MRLSMSILSEWLKPYDPVLNLKKGNRSILNVRMISDNIRISDSTVYLNQIGAHTIVCSNGPDYITLHHDDINDILNEILDALAYYNDYMDQIHSMIMNHCSLDDVLDAGSKLLNKYLVLADPTFYIYKTYGDEKYLAGHDSYYSSLNTHMLPLPVLLDINAEKSIRIPNLPSYEVAVPSMNINTIVTNLFSFATHRGWLIANNTEGQYSQYDKDLQDAFAEILQEWMTINDEDTLRKNRNDIFIHLIDNAEPEEKTVERLSVFHWYPGDPIQLYVIGLKNTASDSGFALLRALEHLDPTAFVFFYDAYVIYITNLNLLNVADHTAKLENILNMCHSCAGKSPLFHELNQVKTHYESALISLKYALENNITIVGIDQIFTPYVKSLIQTHSVIPLQHNALNQLKIYDQQNNTELYDTLYCFLRNLCNFSSTAQELHIHRNTLLYRIDRIRELTHFDLSDYNLRFQLELFYLLDSDM